MVHVVTNERGRRAIQRAKLPGPVVVWHERLYEGAVPQGVPEGAWRQARASYWESVTEGQLSFTEALAMLRHQDEELEHALLDDEVVLWADAGLADQIILVRHLALLPPKNPNARITYASSDVKVGGRLCALGELAAHQIQALFSRRRPVTEDLISCAEKVWAAWTADDPTDLMTLAGKKFPDLPHLHEAILRHLQQYPDVTCGLSRLEFEVLAVLALGYGKLVEIFLNVDRHEQRPHFEDVDLWRCLNQLARQPFAMVVISGNKPLPLWNPPRRLIEWTVGITDVGLEVVHGKQDAVVMNGVDRYLGGVHLKGNSVPWRWDGSRGTLIASAR